MLSEALDRQDTPSGHLAHRREARAHRLSIDEHCAGAAFALVIAPLFGARQTQVAPQDVEYGAEGVNVEGDRLAIEDE
jgi:hypothetical protein